MLSFLLRYRKMEHLDEMTGLHELDLTDNEIRKVFSNVVTVLSNTLCLCGILQIEHFNCLSNLVRLKLSDNLIDFIPQVVLLSSVYIYILSLTFICARPLLPGLKAIENLEKLELLHLDGNKVQYCETRALFQPLLHFNSLHCVTVVVTTGRGGPFVAIAPLNQVVFA